MATRSELWRKRYALYDLRRAASSLDDAGVDATAVQAAAADLESEVLAIVVPCLVCRNQFLQPALVGDDSTPEAVICGPCSDWLMAEVEKDHQGITDDTMSMEIVTDQA
jgi:hypothetical protein